MVKRGYGRRAGLNAGWAPGGQNIAYRSNTLRLNAGRAPGGQAHRAVLLARKAGEYAEEAGRTAVKRMADEAQPRSVYLVQVSTGPAEERVPRPGKHGPSRGAYTSSR